MRSQCQTITSVMVAVVAMLLAWSTAASEPGLFSAQMGLVEVAAHGHYFTLPDGSPLVVVGQVEMLRSNPFLNRALYHGDVDAARTYLSILASHGVNTIRSSIETIGHSSGMLQTLDGGWNPTVLAFWDWFLPLLEEHGFHIILNPYSRKNAEEIRGLVSPLTNPTAIADQERQLRFVIERWGSSPAILAWDIMAEINFQGSTFEIESWISKMIPFIRQIERDSGRPGHLIYVSGTYSGMIRRTGFAPMIHTHPELDLTSIHQYIDPAFGLLKIESTTCPVNTVAPALAVQQATLISRALIEDGRPFLDAESGPQDSTCAGAMSEEFDGEYYHNTAWAALTTGAAGQGLRWPFKVGSGTNLLADRLHRVQLGMRQFIDAFDWRGFAPTPIHRDVSIEGSVEIHPFGIADADRALVWLLVDDPDRVVTNARVTISNRPDGRYRLVFWDTYRGAVITGVVVPAVAGQLRFTLGEIDRSIAIAITREENASTSPAGSSLVIDTEQRPWVDLALGRPVTASSSMSTARAAVDGTDDTAWTPVADGQMQWLQVDLGSVYDVTRTEVHFPPALDWYRRWHTSGNGTATSIVHDNYAYRIETSLDGLSWRTYADHSEATRWSYPYFDRRDKAARYVRLIIPSSSPETEAQSVKSSPAPVPKVHTLAVFGYPKVWIAAPTVGETVQGTVPLRIRKAADVAVKSVLVQLNGSPIYTGSELPTDTMLGARCLVDGSNEIKVTVMDVTGVTYEYETQFRVQNLVINSPEDNATLRGEASIALTSFTPQDQVQSAYVKLVQLVEGTPARETLVYSGPSVPEELTVDTRQLEDSAYDLVAGVGTCAGAVHKVTTRMVVSNWSTLDDAVLPPMQASWFGSTDRMKTIDRSDGWSYVGDDTDRLFGDIDRVTLAPSAQEAYLTWQMPKLRWFVFTVYSRREQVADQLEIAVSPDGETWSVVAYAVDVKDSHRDGWSQLTVSGTPSGEIDSSYIRFTLTPHAESTQTIQLGHVNLKGEK